MYRGIVKDDSDESSFSNNSYSGRRVTVNSNQHDGFKINVQNETNSSFSGENGVAYNQQPRRSHYNKISKPNNVPNQNRSNDSADNCRSDNSKENKPFNREEFASNAPNKRCNKSKIAPSATQEATNKPFIRKTPVHAKQETVVKSPPPAKLINYMTVELPVNEFTAVSVESVISDTVGWVRMVAHDDVVDDMARIIMKETETEPAKCELQVGKLVLAKYETILLRAVVLAIAPEIRVRYIDYGEEAKLAAEDIQGISDRFTSIAAYSFCVKLAEQAPFKMQNGLTMNIKPVRKVLTS